MKYRIRMKTPDCLDYAESYQLYKDEVEDCEAFAELCDRWFQYGEYVTLEVDVDKKTCVVIPL